MLSRVVLGCPRFALVVLCCPMLSRVVLGWPWLSFVVICCPRQSQVGLGGPRMPNGGQEPSPDEIEVNGPGPRAAFGHRPVWGA